MGAFNETNVTETFDIVPSMQTCSEDDIEVLFDTLYYGCCPASTQVMDECFNALKDELRQCMTQIKKTRLLLSPSIETEEPSSENKWDYTSAIVLAFTIVTTIGYGHIAPSTVGGRLFCVFYGLLGIPLTLLAIADHGRFLASGLQFLYVRGKSAFSRAKKKKDEEEQEQEIDEEEEDSLSPALLLVIYILYLFSGSFMLGHWENNWSFLDSLYFSFISLSTIGFGDVVPKNYKYLPFVLLYIGVGLILSSTAIDILAEYLRKLHQFGMKIQNVQMQKIWFGGKTLTVKELVSSVGKYLGAPDEVMAQLVENLDVVVTQCIEEKETGITHEEPLISHREAENHVEEEEESTPEPEPEPEPITPKPQTPKPPTPKPESPKKDGFGSEVGFIDDHDDE